MVSSVVAKPVAVMTLRDLPPDEWTTYEMMAYVGQHGWQIVVWEKNSRRPEPVALKAPGAAAAPSSDLFVDNTKQWVCRTGKAHISPAYLLAWVRGTHDL